MVEKSNCYDKWTKHHDLNSLLEILCFFEPSYLTKCLLFCSTFKLNVLIFFITGKGAVTNDCPHLIHQLEKLLPVAFAPTTTEMSGVPFLLWTYDVLELWWDFKKCGINKKYSHWEVTGLCACCRIFKEVLNTRKF